MSAALLLILAANAGYGDDPHQRRTHEELQTALWISAARVAPSAFDIDYGAGGCAFDAGLYWPDGPRESAYMSRAADEDAESLLKTLQSALGSGDCVHTPCLAGNGNVAGWLIEEGVDPRRLVFQGLLCDVDGRRNLFGTTEAALGIRIEEVQPRLITGFVDFSGALPEHLWLYALTLAGEDQTFSYTPLRVGMCEPDGTCSAVWDDDASAPDGPGQLYVTNGDWRMALTLQEGEPSRGLYQGSTIDAEPLSDCGAPYWFVWESAAGVRGTFPATGGLTPEGCEDSWAERPFPSVWFGCATADPEAGATTGMVMLALLLLRRREPR